MRGLARIVVLMAACLVGAAGLAHAQGASDRYDAVFRKYSKRFFGPGFDWRIFKAQGMVESNLDPVAKSGVGARGIMQLMPSTYREVQSKNPDLGDMSDPEWNIAAGVGHARLLWNQWLEDADAAHRREFMLGSYNAGRGPLIRAQRLAQERLLDQRTWPSIQIVAPEVPRWRYAETMNYVDRVRMLLLRMDPRGRIR